MDPVDDVANSAEDCDEKTTSRFCSEIGLATERDPHTNRKEA